MSKPAGPGTAGGHRRFSVNLMPTAPVVDLVELAVLAEQLGAKRCWVYDEGLLTRDVYVALTAIASATGNLLIGPGITNPYVRHPGATAAAIATLDEFSRGRAFLGLGAGGGLTLDPLRIDRVRPLTAVREMMEALRRLFAGATVDVDGAVFGFRDARLGYARPDIEVFLAGRGPRMIQLGGKMADGFNLSYIHKELLGDHVAALKEAAGDRRFTVTYTTMVATSDAEIEDARAALSYRLVDSPPHVKERLGLTSGDIDSIRDALATGGPTAAGAWVKPEWVPQFVLVGSAAECVRELAKLMEDNDIDEFQLPVLDIATGAEMIERIAKLL
ncbi:MAG: LLM class flavin-dependent oxidoreductase [Acidimicrobiales bacterium]